MLLSTGLLKESTFAEERLTISEGLSKSFDTLKQNQELVEVEIRGSEAAKYEEVLGKD